MGEPRFALRATQDRALLARLCRSDFGGLTESLVSAHSLPLRRQGGNDPFRKRGSAARSASAPVVARTPARRVAAVITVRGRGINSERARPLGELQEVIAFALLFLFESGALLLVTLLDLAARQAFGLLFRHRTPALHP